jgi:hypothetical protein
MRFDEFVEGSDIAVCSVDLFTGLVVEVGVPPGWEPFDSAVGVRVWVRRTDPRIEAFCANAVLTMHRVEAVLDAEGVFAMLADQQRRSVRGCHELHRELGDATEGPGGVGVLALEITHELGAIDSVSQSRIITTEQETLIAQLTATALHDSPVERGDVRLNVRMGAAAGSASLGHRVGARAPVTREGPDGR